MAKKCEHCNYEYEGNPNYCPSCGARLVKKNELGISPAKKDKKRLEILKQLNLIKALYCCHKVNSAITNSLNNEIKNIDLTMSNYNDTKAEDVVNKKKYWKPENPGAVSYTGLLARIGLFVLIPVVIICAIIASTNENNFWVGTITGIIAIGTAVIYGLVLAISGIVYSTQLKKANKEHKKRLKEAEEYNKQVDEEYAENIKNFNLYKEQKINNLHDSREELLKRKGQYTNYEMVAKEAYEKVLNCSIVHPKYRDIVPICQFIDYLDTQRCWDLIDVDGCYNKYEEELRQNLIITKLEEINYQLERIEDNQRVLAKALISIDDKMRSMSQVICNIESKVYDVEDNLIAIKSCQDIIASHEAEIVANSDRLINDMYYYNHK